MTTSIPTPPAPTTPAIEARGLWKTYSTTPAVFDVSLSVETGTVYGLLGRNGAGKSTLVKMLMGMIGPDLGSSSILGVDSQNLPVSLKAKIGYMAENHPLYDHWTIGQSIRFVKNLHPKWDEDLVGRVLQHFGLSISSKISRLSRGQRAQVALVLTLGGDPDVFILDDPTLGLDPGVRRDFIESLVHMINRRGRTILFSSHMLDDIDRTADRIGIMVDGVLRVDCPLDTFRNQVRKVVVEFDQDPPPWNGCPGLVQQWQVGKRRDLVFVGYGDLQRRAVEALEPKRIDLVELSLEDAFIEYTRTNRNPLPLWEENHE